MPSPFPGMDPFLEKNPIFHELHTLLLSLAEIQLQRQLRPKYVARLERHLSEHGDWDGDNGQISLDGKEPDISVATADAALPPAESTAVLAAPSARLVQELDEDDLQLRRQRRIVIYVRGRPRRAVASVELLSPSNKEAGSGGQRRYLAKRSAALDAGLHWIEIDLLRGGQRPPNPLTLAGPFDYLAYVAQSIPTGWDHRAYAWGLRDPLPRLQIPLLGDDVAELDLAECFRTAYDGLAADDEADYAADAPPPPLRPDDAAWADDRLRAAGLRPR